METVNDAANRIRTLRVQGATNVALTAVNALTDQVLELETLNRELVLSVISEARDILFNTRETEPFMRNAVRFVESKILEASWDTLEELKDLVKETSQKIINDLSEARESIVDVGTNRILPGVRVLTHCHSSAVTSVLKNAREKGTRFQVICTESRPVYQGRITARELVNSGIETTMIVDSAVRSFMNKVDLVLVGADAITSEGNVINKIGTSQIALMAYEARTPFYVVSELLKFDPETIHGEHETIEERDVSEIWPDAPKGLTLRNPAFDVTRRDYIHGIICEEGIISPHSIIQAVMMKYPWVIGLKN